MSDSKNKKTRKRINTIEKQLYLHQENINLLRNFFDNNKMKFSSKDSRVVKYSCLPKSYLTYQFTLENISKQIIELEKELSTLYQYGV